MSMWWAGYHGTAFVMNKANLTLSLNSTNIQTT